MCRWVSVFPVSAGLHVTGWLSACVCPHVCVSVSGQEAEGWGVGCGMCSVSCFRPQDGVTACLKPLTQSRLLCSAQRQPEPRWACRGLSPRHQPAPYSTTPETAPLTTSKDKTATTANDLTSYLTFQASLSSSHHNKPS